MLRRSTDRKTANSVTASASPNIANAFGLPSGKNASCPGATSVCESVCYAGRMEKYYPAALRLVTQNFDLLRNASYFEMRKMLSAMIAEFDAECDRKGADKIFRIHHDGDFFSRDYAQAWADTVRAFPHIQFWVYTRSFLPGINVTDLIADIPNLSVYLSVDSVNMGYARTILDEYPSIRIASLTKTMEQGKDIVRGIRGTSRPGAACPENIKRLPLIDNRGGACKICDICVSGKADIRLASGKR